MDNLDDIQFTAINSGLGLQEPKILTEMDVEDLEPPKVAKVPVANKPKTVAKPAPQPQRSSSVFKTLFSLAFDHLFVVLFYGTLLITSYWVSSTQFGVQNFWEWLSIFNHEFSVVMFGLLFVVIYIFYFSFFMQFKIPSLGQWMMGYEAKN